MEIKAYLKRHLRSGQESIEVVIDGHENNMWQGIIGHCSKFYSNSELRTISEMCGKQIEEMGIDNTPFCFTEMMNELNQTIINRKAYLPHKEEVVVIAK